jgi:hypothetical protein
VEAEPAQGVGGRAVALVARDRMAHARELHADLVLAPGLELELEEAVIGAGREELPRRARSLGAPLVRRRLAHPARAGRREPGIEAARAAADPALDEGDVAPLGHELVPATHDIALGHAALREDHDARGAAVDAVDHGCPGLGVLLPQGLGHDVEEAGRPAAVRRDDREAGRLVHGHDLPVLVEEPHGASIAGRGAHDRGAAGLLPRIPVR